jgi:hypothetical protein
LLVGDCKLGYVCVPQSDGTRRCSDKVDSLVSTEDAATVGNGAHPPMGDSGQGADVAAAPGLADDGGAETGGDGSRDAPALE